MFDSAKDVHSTVLSNEEAIIVAFRRHTPSKLASHHTRTVKTRD